MIKGLLSLFTSGIIFNPMVLGGVILGIFCMTEMENEAIRALFLNYNLYLAVLLFSILYNFLFKRVYDGASLDMGAMVGQIILGVIRFVFAAVLTMSFVVLISF